MTHPTDEELDALVKRLTWAAGIDQAEYPFPLCNEAAAALTALRAQLAEVQAERAFTVSDGQRMLRKQDIITVCDTPDLCFESDDGVARCGPCAKKLAERDGITLNQYTVSNPAAMRLRRELVAANARADRAEASLAAGHTADVLCNWPSCGHTAKGQCLPSVVTHVPHDRTALDRMRRAESEKALREAGAAV